jgi:hypothetical protein
MTPVTVTWRDCYAVTDTWTDISNLDLHDRIIRSCGFVVETDRSDLLVIAQSVDGDNLDHVLAIPIVQVIEVRHVTDAGKAVLRFDQHEPQAAQASNPT